VKRRHFSYSVSESEAVTFAEDNSCIREFLNMYDLGGVSFGEKAIGLARFFSWLKVVKNIEISPADFLNTHLRKSKTNLVEERRWALRLALEYSRDNPDLMGNAASYKYGAWFLPIKMFCDYHEAPLTTRKGFFPKRGRRKYSEKPFTADYIRRILGVLSQRDRAICMTELQSGQSIKQVLIDINKQCNRIFREIDSGKQRIRFDFKERKGNGFAYFTFISQDAIQEIQKWRPIRAQILKRLGVDSPYLFITKTGKPMSRKKFHNSIRLTFIRHKIYNGPLSVRSHGFRKFFEQEASPPDRGISKSYITFMMGHSSGKDSNGIQINHPLDVVGGTYDNSPKVYPEVIEKEYAKLEPYINIYTGSHSSSLNTLDNDALSFFEKFNRVLETHPDKMKKFERFILNL
jgi:integrase